jgi:hypothetical protein
MMRVSALREVRFDLFKGEVSFKKRELKEGLS